MKFVNILLPMHNMIFSLNLTRNAVNLAIPGSRVTGGADPWILDGSEKVEDERVGHKQLNNYIEVAEIVHVSEGGYYVHEETDT
jgi:hypothetical protein